METESVHVYPNGNNGNGVSDLALIAAMNNGGFGNNMNPLWMMFMYPFIFPFMNMFGGGMWGNGFGGFGGGNTGFLANQLNNDAGREVIMQAINGRSDALSQLAQMTNNSVSN